MSQTEMERAKEAAAEELHQVIAQHQQPVFAYLRTRLLQPSDAEDMTQEVFLRWFEGRGRFDNSAQLRPWLLGIARNVLRERLRKMKQRREVAWTESCLELDALQIQHGNDSASAVDDLPNCLRQLTQSARQAIELRYRSELRLAEIGQRLRRSEGAVKLLMFRARQALKNCLERNGRAACHPLPMTPKAQAFGTAVALGSD